MPSLGKVARSAFNNPFLIVTTPRVGDMSITVLPLQLGKPRHDTPSFSFSVGFSKSPACMTSEGLLLPPRRLSEPSCPPASQKESSSGSSAASGFVLRPAAPAPLSRTFLKRSSWPRSGCPSRPPPPAPAPRLPFPGPRRAGSPQPSAPQEGAGRCCSGV